jgi:hypothetical protein
MASAKVTRVRTVRKAVTPEEAAEELRLWADYYEATMRALDLVRTGGATTDTLSLIVAEDARAAAAIKRIKTIRGIGD